MNQRVSLFLAQPLPFTAFENERVYFTDDDTTIEVNLYEGIVTLPDGKKVLASGFVDCAKKILSMMRAWKNLGRSQVNPVWDNRDDKKAIKDRLNKEWRTALKLKRQAGDRRDWDRVTDLEGQITGLKRALVIVESAYNA